MKFLKIFGKSVLSFILIVIGVGLLLQEPFYAGPIAFIGDTQDYNLFPFVVNLLLMHLLSVVLLYMGFKCLWSKKLALVILVITPAILADTITYFSIDKINFEVKEVVPLYFGRSGYVKASLEKGTFVLSEFKAGRLNQDEKRLLCEVDSYYEKKQLHGRYAEGYEKIDAPVYLPDPSRVAGTPFPVVPYSRLVEIVKSSAHLCK